MPDVLYLGWDCVKPLAPKKHFTARSQACHALVRRRAGSADVPVLGVLARVFLLAVKRHSFLLDQSSDGLRAPSKTKEKD